MATNDEVSGSSGLMALGGLTIFLHSSEKVLMSEMDMLLNATDATKLRYVYFAPLPSLPLPLYIQLPTHSVTIITHDH